VFEEAFATSISAAVLSDTKFVVAYREENSTYGKAVIGDISGTTISFGSGWVFNSASTNFISTAVLSSTRFVVAYSGNFGYGTVVIGDASGTAITYGSEYVFSNAETIDISAASLAEAKFVVAYRDAGNSDYGTAVVGNVSGETITYGSEKVFNYADTFDCSAASLTEDKFVVAYRDVGNSDYGTAVIGNVSGAIITYGLEYVFNSASTEIPSVAVLSSTRIVVAYLDDSSFGNGYGTAVVGDVSGTTINYGFEFVFNTNVTLHVSAVALSPTRFVVAYQGRDGVPQYYGAEVIGVVSGLTISYSVEYVFNSGDAHEPSIAALSDATFIVAYVDNSGDGTAVIGHSGNTVGIAKESKAAGQFVPVIINGVSDVHMGLTPGAIYYNDLAGGLTTSKGTRRIGLAISDTELLLNIDIYE